MSESKLYSFSLNDINGKPKSLADFKGMVLLIVNVASECGNTPQYKGMQEAYDKFHAQGFEILGFPANNFGAQEPGSDAEVKAFCTKNYGVTFPLFSKISVKGSDMHPLYGYLTTETDFKGDVTWNFGKFLADREGRVIARFSPKLPVESSEISAAINSAL